MRPRIVRRVLAPAAALVAAAVASSAPASGSAPAEGDPPAAPRTALLLFVSYEGNLPSRPDPTRLRGSAIDALSAALVRSGHDVLGLADVELAMREGRIRSERDVGEAFLDTLATRFAAEQVVLARLTVYRDRVLLLARGVSAATGALAWVGSDERPRSLPSSAPAGEVLAELETLAALAAPNAVPDPGAARGGPAGGSLVVLPLRAIGLERGPSSLAMHCVFRSLLEARRWAIPDPALVVSALIADGFDPFQLEEDARLALARRFGAAAIVVPRLVSFPQGATSSPASPEVESDLGAPDREWSIDDPVLLSLVVVDCASGRVVSGGGEYLAPEKHYGMFGVARDVPLERRFQTGADRLVRALVVKEGASE
jgi:hypothetical protein